MGCPAASASTRDEISVEALAQSLLHDPVPDEDEPGRLWAYPPIDMVLVSLFIAFHVVTLLVYGTPSTGLLARLHGLLDRNVEMSGYMGLTGNTPAWGMFAPNPYRNNMFARVLVEDQSGETWDLRHDIYGRRRYPYLFYDRMGKVNRQLIEQKEYRLAYAAWVCRNWERRHGGEPARSVRIVATWTRIPPPEQTYPTMGYQPLLLDLQEASPETFECATIPHGQLPPALRARYGLPAQREGAFREVSVRTWWDRRQGLGTEEALQEASDARSEAMSGGESGIQ